jgi:hypothetical protein
MGSQAVNSTNRQITARKERMEDKELVLQELSFIIR